MTSIEIAQSFDELEALLRRPAAPAEPVLLTKDGVAYAALVPLKEEPDAETQATWKSRRFQEVLARSRADSAAGREQELDEVARELGLAGGAR
jgi:antitoxin (DNA-binding transcriptional repressor) of toxin-antitoxin stability system